jgi:lipid-binding SYLF domain-containing protein
MKTLLIVLSLLCLIPLAAAQAASPDEQRAAVQQIRDQTLARLYRVNPDAEREIQSAVGYAVLSSGSIAIIYFTGGYGHGVAHDNRTGRDIYMEMATGGVGLGLGVKDYKTVFVFHDAAAFQDFIVNGLDMSGNTDAAAKQGLKGEAYSGSADVLKGVRVYQLTDDGLMAQAMLQGTKYWQDDALNGQDHAFRRSSYDNPQN